ncbi:MAG: YicC family protein [Halobacteriovoraceae bacterium]|nr:YicC family protein [Halobacteriovoraceae bacterium]|tara:strand:- start:17208 stop:18083 length:876 start_codon:yes stop_codon:yes gene_type:complete
MPSQSMTGFGRGEAHNDNYTLVVEIKAVNHRFKDIRFKMGSVFNAKEIELRKQMEKKFSRGSFDIYVNYKKNQNATEKFEIDYKKVNLFINELKNEIEDGDIQFHVNPTEFLRSDFYREDETKEDQLQSLLESAFHDACHELEKSRCEEGKGLLEKLEEHKAQYEKAYSQILPLKNEYQPKLKEKLLKKFEAEANDLKIEESRFLQEVIYYLEKLDIDEEINRIQIHLNKLNSLIHSNESEVGRQIDFIIQELNRETNTIGSKSGANDISELVVQMKVQIEKIREQALNLQ